MELTFILKATRRFWWVLAGCIALGALVSVMLDTTSDPYFQSQAIILVSPPSESRVQVTFTNDPDRYVLSQLSILRSDALADSVAARVEGETTETVLSAISIQHATKTDVVEVVAKYPDPERAKAVAQAYVDVYMDQLRNAVDDTQLPELEQLSEQLASLGNQITLVDKALEASIAPFIPTPGLVPEGRAYPPIPPLESLSPSLISQKQGLVEQFNQLLTTKTELELSGKLRVTTQVVQRATLPTTELVDRNRLVGVAGVVGGAFVGLLACVALARLSRTSSDAEQAAAMLGGPLVGQFPRSRLLARSRRAAVEQLPQDAIGLVDDLCVRAEAHASVGKALTVLVAGTERASGTTTLAAAMASRYAANGSHVLLIDVDSRDPELTRLFAAASPGIPGLLARGAEVSATPRGRDVERADPFSSTVIPGLDVVGIGDKTGRSAFRRQQVPEIIDVASRHAHVVVFDGGPLMEAASTVQLAQLVDAVVLAMPGRRQLHRVLTSIASQIKDRTGEVLVVAMPARRPARSMTGQSSQSPIDVAGEPDLVSQPS
jgi:capsular polysaccharide biosynthesis protein/Mrp family chromosome partitioning ATPase